ncbi:MAG TPA: septum formation family protein [Candidatus Limnocylindrales bacterium]|nr:septum formation family protein [Candidatus Limnocylindrales bacterium]
MGTERPVRERDRYARASLREQAGDLLAELREHPGIIALLVCMAGGWLVLTITKPAVVQVEDLKIGDCLYIHAPDADTDAPNGRPAGTSTAAVAALYGQGAERASCDASHSHEVIVPIVFPDAPGASYPGAAGLGAPWREPCDDAFTGWVGVEPVRSELEVVIAVPSEKAWDKGQRAGACLVARADGQFIAGQAKGSGR